MIIDLFKIYFYREGLLTVYDDFQTDEYFFLSFQEAFEHLKIDPKGVLDFSDLIKIIDYYILPRKELDREQITKLNDIKLDCELAKEKFIVIYALEATKIALGIRLTFLEYEKVILLPD